MWVKIFYEIWLMYMIVILVFLIGVVFNLNSYVIVILFLIILDILK